MESTIFRSKLPKIGTSIFTIMSAMAKEHEAINLSQGFPDFSCDPILVDLVSKYMQSGYNQYAPMPGVLALRESISELIHHTYDANYDPIEEITITSGASEALFCALAMAIHPGDEVIIFEPFYEAYLSIIEMLGGIPICLTLGPPEFRIDWQQVKDHLTPRTKAILLNSPHNPTGTILEKEDIGQLTELALNHEFMVISDEVYEYMVFDEKQHLSLASVDSLADRTMVIGSFGKSLHATGWKVGYCLAPKSITQEFRKVHQFVTFAVITPFQYAIADYISSYREKLWNLAHFYQKKRDIFLKEMSSSKFEFIPSQGTYFQLMSYDSISGMNDVDFSHYLTKEIGVACIPISAFYIHEHQQDISEKKIIRFCFAKKEDTLREAAHILCSTL